MLVKNLHMMWLSKDNAENVPDKYIPYVNTWRKHHPGWNMKIWYNKDVDRLLDEYPNNYREFFNKLQPLICKCDFARFLVVYKYGGLYVDLDFVCRKGLDSLLEDKKCLIFQEIPEHEYFKKKQLYNGIFYFVPKHVFVKEWLEYMMNHYNPTQKNIVFKTGPILFYEYYEQSPYKKEVNIGDMCLVAPYTDKNLISKICNSEEFDPYSYTLWKDGHASLKQTKEKKPNKILLIFLVLFLVLGLFSIFDKRIIMLIMMLIIVIILSLKLKKELYSKNDKIIFSFPVQPTDYVSKSKIPSRYFNKKYKYFNPSLMLIENEPYIWFRKASNFLCEKGSTIKGNVNQHIFCKINLVEKQIELDTIQHFYLPIQDTNLLFQTCDNLKFKKASRCKYFGAEDIRTLYNPKIKRVILLGNLVYCSRFKITGMPYYAEFDHVSGKITYEKLLWTEFSKQQDKNWMPLLHQNKLYIIYSLFPYILLEPNLQTGKCTIYHKQIYSYPYRRGSKLHGGSSPFPYKNFYLGIAHTVLPGKKYKHLFYLLNSEMMLVALSDTFCIDKLGDNCGIQFAIGLLIDKDENVWISFGENDCESRIVKYQLKDILSTLKNI